MATTTFSAGTVVASSWLNDVNTQTYDRIDVRTYGAVADGNSATGGGTDNSAAFTAAIAAAVALGINSVYIPGGIYLLVTGISIPSQFTLQGAGNFATVLLVKNAFNSTTGVINMSGAGGPPTVVQDLAVVAQVNGAGAVSCGINCAANGGIVRNVWVNGFNTNIKMASSDTMLIDSVVEETVSNGPGVQVSVPAVTVSNCILYNCYIGMFIIYTPTLGFGLVVDNVRSETCTFVGFYLQGTANVQLNNCSVGHNNTGRYASAGILVDSSSRVAISNFMCSLGAGPSTTGVGIKIQNSSSAVSVTGGYIRDMYDGIQATACSKLNINGVTVSNNYRHGIYAAACDQVVINGNICTDNGTVAVTDSGIFADNTSSFSNYVISNNLCTQSGGGAQDYGIYANLTDNGTNTGSIVMTGNSCSFSNVAQIQLAGKTNRIVMQNNIPAGGVASAATTAVTTATYTLGLSESTIICAGSSNQTLTLPTAATSIGREITIMTIVGFNTLSATANVVPINGAAATTAILPNVAGKWVRVACDGAQWRIVAGN